MKHRKSNPLNGIIIGKTLYDAALWLYQAGINKPLRAVFNCQAKHITHKQPNYHIASSMQENRPIGYKYRNMGV